MIVTDSPVVFGVPIDDLSLDDAVEEIERLVADGRASERSHQLGTVNVDFLVNALADDSLLEILRSNSLNLADGTPVVWASRLVGAPVCERVAGADLVIRLIERSAAGGPTIHVFGGSADVASRARVLIDQRWPTARITIDPGPIIDDVDDVDPQVLEKIRLSDPDVLLVALGNPKQERFMYTHGPALGCPVMIGIGGSLDMLVGERRRAPNWIQRIGAEWIFRLVQEPARLGPRYGRDLRVFLPRLTGLVGVRRRHRRGTRLTLRSHGGNLVVTAGDGGDGSWSEIASSHADGQVVIDLDGLRSLAPESHAALVGLVRSARRHGIPVSHGTFDESTRRCFSQLGSREIITSESRSR